ncbi:MAG: isoamylase early set domain-containing protein [Anaerolineae bacterium]|jgi:1,4-alpha-glucan branching enzyme|uniref:isoamylase early set domain-containing protein n=1 Tax=Candidatus Flexifilum breve TaxID=3140694 RepID=UPI001ACB0614|nr:isoamylase early set domain-containing protein [Chloroflexota bacterium]MBK9745898.1 isoamylase early set domain-containing protein [Chloroflexota bacterium]MBN8638398.1 isoamylase early set domain-containing protein [Anaerolineae bacterium]
MLKKQYLKTKNVCKVTFSLPAAVQGETVFLVGDFNNWDEKATPMKRQKDGSFTTVLELEKGREYQFRYLVNGTEWHNDWEADRYVPNPFSGDNSVVVTEGDAAPAAEASAEAKPKRATKPRTPKTPTTKTKTTGSKSKAKTQQSS